MGKRKRMERTETSVIDGQEQTEEMGQEVKEGANNYPNISHPKKRAFLLAYERLGVITQAAQAAGIDRRTVTHWRHTDPDFAEAFEEAQQAVADMLEREAIRRAVEGWDEPVFQKGKHVGNVRKYSDTLLIFLMKGAQPEKYSDRLRAEIEHSGGINVEIAIPDEVDD